MLLPTRRRQALLRQQSDGLQFKARKSLRCWQYRAVLRLCSWEITLPQKQGPGSRPGPLEMPILQPRSSELQAKHANQLVFQPLYFQLPGVLFLGPVVQSLL